MKRPKAIVNCVADRYSSKDERRIELSWPDGSGCLLNLYTDDKGKPHLTVYAVGDDPNPRDPKAINVIVEPGVAVWRSGKRLR